MIREGDYHQTVQEERKYCCLNVYVVTGKMQAALRKAWFAGRSKCSLIIRHYFTVGKRIHMQKQMDMDMERRGCSLTREGYVENVNFEENICIDFAKLFWTEYNYFQIIVTNKNEQ